MPLKSCTMLESVVASHKHRFQHKRANVVMKSFHRRFTWYKLFVFFFCGQKNDTRLRCSTEALELGLIKRCNRWANVLERSRTRRIYPLRRFGREQGVSLDSCKSGDFGLYDKTNQRGVAFVRGGESWVGDDEIPETKDEATSKHQRGSPAFLIPSYYLVWSPGVWKKIVSGLGILLVARFAALTGIPLKMDHTVSSPLKPFFELLVLPMLSSACCGIQLLMNALVGASGCAGFNACLGPLRPYILSLLSYTTVLTFPGRTNPIDRWVRKTILSYFVAFMPEMVHLWNNVAETRWRRNQQAATRAPTGSKVNATVWLEIPSMGCVACINKINSSLRQSAPHHQVLETQSWLTSSETQKGGKAKIKLAASSQNEIDELAHTLVESVRDAGFEACALESVNVEDTG